MSRKFPFLVLVGFFMTVCVVIVWRFTQESTRNVIVKRSLSETALSLFNEDLRSLTAAQIEAQKEEITLHRLTLKEQSEKINARIAFIPFQLKVKRYSWTAAPVVISLCFIILSVGLTIAFVRRRSVFLARVDNSEIPVKYADLDTMKPVMMGLVTAKIETAFAGKEEELFLRLRGLLSDFATLTRSVGGRRGMFTLPEPVPLSAPRSVAMSSSPASVPTFEDILQHLAPGDDMYLGSDFSTGDALTGSFDDLYSSFIAGRSGSGKSSWLRGLILQSLLVYPDIHFFVLDPHCAHPESLSKSLPKTEHFTFVNSANPVKDIYKFNRLLQDRLDNPIIAAAPLVFVCDELSFCSRQRYASPLKTLLERISNEGRKVKTYILASSQDTRLKKSGDFRDLLSSCYVFNLKSGQARNLLQDREEVQKHKIIRDNNLKGVALFSPTEEESRLVRLAECRPAHVAYVEAKFFEHQNSPTEQARTALGTSSEQPKEPAVLTSIRTRFEQSKIGYRILSERLNIGKTRLHDILNGKRTQDPERQTILDAVVKVLDSLPEQPGQDNKNDAPVLLKTSSYIQ